MSQITVLTGPERRRRWPEEQRRKIVTEAFAPGASVAVVARQYDLATSLIYKWRQQALEANGDGPSFTPAWWWMNRHVHLAMEPRRTGHRSAWRCPTERG